MNSNWSKRGVRHMGWTRRQVLQTLAVGAGAASLPFEGRSVLGAEPPDIAIRRVAAPDRVSIRPGPTTDVLRFTARVIAGRADAVRPSIGDYLGPTLEFRHGERVRIEFVNRIDEFSIVHWHGMIVPTVADGHPRFAVAPGSSYVYDFTVRNPAGTYLYHPHPHWTFSNDTGGMAMPHPMHIHRVRSRVIEPAPGAPTELREGLIDTGYRDTVLVFPGEAVRVAVAPTEPGLFMYHCHNLEHEDGGMMRNCWFGPGPVSST
ncbi:MAG: multicopper oxidase domain-containing protein [Casimicrobiaceae bacterium]